MALLPSVRMTRSCKNSNSNKGYYKVCSVLIVHFKHSYNRVFSHSEMSHDVLNSVVLKGSSEMYTNSQDTCVEGQQVCF